MWPHYTRQISSPHHSINIQLQVVYTTSTNDWCPRIWNPFRIDHPFPINFFTWKKERKIKLYNLYGYQKWGRKHCYCNKSIWYCTQWKFTHKKSIKEREYLWIATSSLNANYICHQNNNNRFFFFLGKGGRKKKKQNLLDRLCWAWAWTCVRDQESPFCLFPAASSSSSTLKPFILPFVIKTIAHILCFQNKTLSNQKLILIYIIIL